MTNKNLSNARSTKNDEFYTMLEDINEELQHYKDFFKNKIVYCNCDDSSWSNFWRFFYVNFEFFGLKKLVATSYKESEPTNKFEYYGGYNKSDYVKNDYMEGVIKTSLTGNGDFRSEECLAILEEADVVVTNPPFSLFREFIVTLMKYEKKFLVICNLNCVTYKEIFPLIRDNKMWPGFCFNKVMEFIMPDHYELKGKAYIDELGRKHGFVPAVCWMTNIEHNKKHRIVEYYCEYSEDKYPKYSNYDAIDVGKSSDIPCDYTETIGVPITWLDKYCSEQFDIIDISPHFFSVVEKGLPKPDQLHIAGRKDPYCRILIKWKPEAMPTINDGVILYGKQKSDCCESGKKR